MLMSAQQIRVKMKEESKNKAENKVAEASLEEKNSFLEDLQRVQADFENYIKRVEKEKEQLKLHAKGELLLKLIRIKEDFERAVKDTKDTGVIMIHKQLKKVLEEERITEIEAVGKDLDYELHDVVKTVESEDNKIIEEIQKGYMLGDRVLRTSKVILGNGKIGGNQND